MFSCSALSSVTQGTDQSAKFLEISHYNSASTSDAQPLAFVGKGITFDSGGISLKPSAAKSSLFNWGYFAHKM
ncbi:hypothetical protein EDB19DRAFT_1758178 [Suillus lakei]|nr:hypothetical protein EDB19DRAFT_1758178 [Suillus lakei]